MNSLITLLGFSESDMPAILTAAIGLLVSLVLIYVIRRISARRLASWADRRGGRFDHDLLSRAASAVFWFSTLVAFHATFRMLPLRDELTSSGDLVFTVLYTVATVSLLISMMSFFLDVYLRKKGSSLSSHRGRVVLPIIKGIAWLCALAFILENMGLDVSTILAGLGVAGIAVGFAAQAILGDLFSYFAILFDRPFRIGDFVFLSQDVRGHIEHIGLKTARLRSLDGEQIILSNTDLTNSRVKNYRRMQRRRSLFRFGVLYSTSADKLEEIPRMVERIIDSTSRATFDRAHFQGFGESSLDFEVVYFVESPEMLDFMDIQQEVNLALVRAFDQAGIEFAYPTRTLHIEQGQERTSE